MFVNSITNLTPQQLRHAAQIQESIDRLRHELTQLLGSSAQRDFAVSSGKRKLSAQGLANIKAGQRRRWAMARGRAGHVTVSFKPKQKMSAAGRAHIASALRARWAAAKRAGRNAL